MFRIRHFFESSLGPILNIWGSNIGLLNMDDAERILMYHSIEDSIPNDKKGLFTISKNNFIEQIKMLSSYSMGRLSNVNDLKAGKLAITFDDGYINNLRIAAPILNEYKVPFVVYVTAGYVKSNNKLYLNPAELRELSLFPGATIGGHGMTHRRLSKCNKSELKNELSDSKRYLEDVLGTEIKTMAYPHGDYNASVIESAKEFGYELCVTTKNGVVVPNESLNCYALNRTAILSYDTLATINYKLNGCFDWIDI